MNFYIGLTSHLCGREPPPEILVSSYNSSWRMSNIFFKWREPFHGQMHIYKATLTILGIIWSMKVVGDPLHRLLNSNQQCLLFITERQRFYFSQYSSLPFLASLLIRIECPSSNNTFIGFPKYLPHLGEAQIQHKNEQSLGGNSLIISFWTPPGIAVHSNVFKFLPFYTNHFHLSSSPGSLCSRNYIQFSAKDLAENA